MPSRTIQLEKMKGKGSFISTLDQPLGPSPPLPPPPPPDPPR